MIAGTGPHLIENFQASIAEPLADVQRRFDEELSCDHPFISRLCEHIRGYRGKMLRPMLCLLSGQACGRLSDEHITLAAVLEMVHMATLVHDDVLDEADTRRRSPTIHAMTDNETAVLLGDYLISHAYHLCSSLHSTHASRTVAACTNTVCEGELMQVYHRRDWRLDESQYLDIITRKTAALTAAACELGAYYAQTDLKTVRNLTTYGLEAGIAFQIVDDVLDLIGTESEMGKTLGRDLEKAKPTLPVIHFLRTASDQQRRAFEQLQERWLQRERSAIIDLLNGSIDYALSQARRHVQSAIESLESLPPSSARQSLVAMAEFILLRRH